jgi:periplasmic copper chaperone A
VARSRTARRSGTPRPSATPRRSRRTALAGLLAASLVLAGCGGGEGELTLSDARSRMSPMLTGVGAVYVDIENATDEDDRLLGARVDPAIAGRVELHETFDTAGGEGEMDDGAMQDADEDAADGAMDDDAMDDGMDDDAVDDGMGDGAMDGDAEEGMDGPMAPTTEGFAMMGMREIESLAIPAGETVALEPGGHHLMLLDLAADLEPGQEFDLTLEFEGAGERTITVTVREQV